MIKYQLICDCKHQFESWFRSSENFDDQRENKLLSCPMCGSDKVQKAMMAPHISSAGNPGKIANEMALDTTQNEFLDDVRKLRQQVAENADYVGDKFSDEARKMHYGETKERGIYGEANIKDVGELHDEGIKVLPLPALPEEKN